MANTISTSTNALASAYTPSQLVALSASGDVLVVWFDGSNVKWSYASSPYSSWTTATLLTSIGSRWQAGLYKLSNDNVLLATGNSSANMVSYFFTYNSSLHSWSVGSAVTIEASSVQFNGGSVPMDADAQGRIWVMWSNNSHVAQVYYTPNNGTSWTASTTITEVGGGSDAQLSLAYCGNYIVALYVASGAIWSYARIDAHSPALGSWSASTAIANCFMDNAALGVCFRGVPGSNYGVFVGDEYQAIPTQYYNASTDTWSAVTDIGASSSDQKPTLVSDGTNLYCLWCKQAAANNFSLVYKKWTASTQLWESSSTQLEASGTNIQWPSGGYGDSTLGFVYTVGTASPWSVLFDTKSFASGSNYTFTATEALVLSDASSYALASSTVESLTAADTLLGAGAFSTIESLAAADAQSGALSTSLLDALTLADLLTSASDPAPIDALTLVDVFDAALASSPVEALALADTLTSASDPALLEVATLADVFGGATVQAAPRDVLMLVDVSSVLVAYAVLDALTLTDAFTGISGGGSVVPTTEVIAVFRDGTVVAVFRDGIVQATYRDGTVVATYR